MSLRLKGREVSFKRHPRYEGEVEILKGRISHRAIWLEVLLENGEITTVEESRLYFKAKGKK